MHWTLVLGAVVGVVLAATGTASASVQGCGLAIAASPSVVNYPSGTLPSGSQVSFGETVDLNYSSAFLNSTITIQYYAGGGWRTYGVVAGNNVGYSRTYFPLLAQRATFGSNSLRATSSGCVSNTATFAVVSNPSADFLAVAAYACVGVASGLFLFAGLRMSRRWFLVAAAVVYLAVSPFTGQRYDVYFLIASGIRLLQHVNPFNPGIPPIYPGAYKWAFPPLYVPFGSLSFLLYQAVTHSPLPAASALTPASWYTSMFDVWEGFVAPNMPVLVSLLKLPIVVSALAAGVLLSRMTKSASVLVFWLANPLVILVGAVWGTLDPIATVLALCAVYLFQRGKENHAYLLASMGAAVKIWPALLIPLFVAVDIRKDGIRGLKPLLWVLPSVLLSALIYAGSGSVGDSLYTLIYARSIPTFGAAFTVNGLTWQQLLHFWNAPAVPIFLALGVPAYLLVVGWVYYKRERDMVKWTVVTLLVVFLTYNYVNPQYFVWILPFLILQGRKVAVAVFTALPLILVALSYNIFYFVSPAILPNYFTVGASVADQLKVVAFNETTWLFLLLSGVAPTAFYLALLLHELRPRRYGSWRGLLLRSTKDEEGLVSQPVERGGP